MLEVREYVGDAKGSLEPLHKFSHERSWSWQWKVRSAVVLFRSSIELFSSFGWLGLFFALCLVQTLGDSPDDFLSGNYAMSPTSLSLPLPPSTSPQVSPAPPPPRYVTLFGKKKRNGKRRHCGVFFFASGRRKGLRHFSNHPIRAAAEATLYSPPHPVSEQGRPDKEGTGGRVGKNPG